MELWMPTYCKKVTKSDTPLLFAGLLIACFLLSNVSDFLFLGGNKDIMSECLKYQKPNILCLEYAIKLLFIFFASIQLLYDIKINLNHCEKYHNLESNK